MDTFELLIKMTRISAETKQEFTCVSAFRELVHVMKSFLLPWMTNIPLQESERKLRLRPEGTV